YDFCKSIGESVQENVLLEPYAEECTQLFRRPSMNMFRRIWRARFSQYTEMMVKVFSVAEAKGDVQRYVQLKQLLDFINQDSRINNQLIDETLIDKFGFAILEPFLDIRGAAILPTDKEEALIVEFFERIIGPSAQLHDRRFSTLNDDLQKLLKRWMNGRKLNWAFDVIDSATGRQFDHVKAQQWRDRRSYWHEFWSKGFIDDIQVFMMKNYLNEYRYQHPDIKMLTGVSNGASALVITLVFQGSDPIQVIEMSGNGSLRLFNMRAFPGLDFRNKNTLDYGYVKSLKIQDGKSYAIRHDRYWTAKTKEAIQNLSNYRL
uniref:EH signature domain-containing protein n=1 Tax=uncultured Sutterella sp. TaxID=286133 RepID=UPI002622AFAE